MLDVFDLTRLREHVRKTAPLAGNLVPFADVNGDGFFNEDDSVALIQMIVGDDPAKPLPLASIRESSPFAGESGAALTREVIVRFTMPLSLNAALTTWDANTQTPGNLYAAAGGRKLLTRVELSGDLCSRPHDSALHRRGSLPAGSVGAGTPGSRSSGSTRR